jgi:DNA-directed RNA polymerase specialized sigma24 family protein
MTAQIPERRSRSAREIAEQLHVSPRTVRKAMAEPRSEFLARSAERQRKASEMKDEGLTYRQIAARLDCTPKAAEHLVLRGRQAKAKQAG